MNYIKLILLVCLATLAISANAQRKSNHKNQPTKKAVGKKAGKKGNSPKKEAAPNASNSSASNTQPLTLSQDTTLPNTVTITSSFKPSLRTASKINFSAKVPDVDTTKFSLNYSIPAQNLLFSYQPVPIKPLALTSDSDLVWQNQQYIKLGFGNYTTPYFETGLSFGNPGNVAINIFGNYVSSKGNLPYQKSSAANFKATAAWGSISNHNLAASLSYNLANQNKYGVNNAYKFNEDSLKQNFNTIATNIVLASKAANSYGISYKPQLSVSTFFDNHKANELTVAATVPVAKNFDKNTALQITVDADITNYKNNALTVSNNVFAVSPALKINKRDWELQAGVNPTWNNSEFKLFPNFFASYKITDDITTEAGVKGYYIKNTYKSLAVVNQFIEQPKQLLNTKTNEVFAAVKGAAGSHFTYTAQVSFLNYNNAVLFTNDSGKTTSQNFNILYEPNLKVVKISGEIGYTDKEKLSWLTAIHVTQFTSQDSFPKAYGIIPFEVISTAKYKILKDVFLKADLHFFAGNHYRIQTIQTAKTSSAFDFNIGAEFKLANRLNAYIDFNNLFNNQYQRWNQYSVFGFNVVGGIVYSFN